MKPLTKDAYRLFHEGTLALARVEAAGIHIDVDYLDKATAKISIRIKKLQDRLREAPEFKLWRREFGDKTKPGSREQLGHIVFDILKYPCKDRTKTGKYKTDEASFEHVDLPFVKAFIKLEKLKKAKSTYLDGLRREVVDGFARPVFNLHTVITQRSSCSDPNVQNQIIRNAKIAEIIRRAFIPRKGNIFCEIDYSAMEWRGAVCFWKDPEMIRYVNDPTSDVHRDQAAECFLCKPEQVSKDMRFYAKNQFVFPILYGSYYVQCSRNLWEAVGKAKLKLKDETPVIDWLQSKGITRLGSCDPKQEPVFGTYEHHIKKVEDKFNKRFHVFNSSKEKWYQDYRSKGGFRLATGFWIEGLFSKNFCMNCPVQGPAFHCLLWSLIRLQKWLRREKMKTVIVAEIHDSMLLDGPEMEMPKVLKMARKIMTEDVRKAWPWVIVPLAVEASVTPVGGSWHDKRAIDIDFWNGSDN